MIWRSDTFSVIALNYASEPPSGLVASQSSVFRDCEKLHVTSFHFFHIGILQFSRDFVFWIGVCKQVL